jgi:hypothetical protein
MMCKEYQKNADKATKEKLFLTGQTHLFFE